MITALNPYDTDAEKKSARKPKRVRPGAKPPRLAKPKAVGQGGPQDAEPIKPSTSPPSATPPPASSPETGGTIDPLIGTSIGRCQIEELIGVGRTARVYQARYEALDDRVAVKVLRRRAAENESLVERFHSEARAIATVDNENVLKIYDVGTEGGLHYMVVELLEGEEILALIQREGQVEVMDALRIVRQAANGLRAAHERELVHRDVKPENLFLLEDGTLKVLDFGLATSFDESSERVGTPHYMAPEVCEAGTVAPANDIYGLGISLFHLLTGRPPYVRREVKAILSAHLAGLPLRPEQQRRGLPKEVADFLRLLTRREPRMRPTAAEVVDALDRIGGKELREKKSLRRRRKRSRARLAVARRERAGKQVPAVAAVVGVILAVAVAFFVFGSGGSRPNEPDGKEAKSPDPASRMDAPAEVETPEQTPEQRAANETRARMKAREPEAREALKVAEAYARRIWHGPDDTDAVLIKYMSVWNRYEFTTAGKEARRRARAIKHKKMHPHPDRVLTSKGALEAAQKAWDENRLKVEEMIRLHDYRAARRLVPAPVSDASGSFPRELDFWREHTRLLEDFQTELISKVAKLPLERRTIDTPSGEGSILRLTSRAFGVRVGRRTDSLSWSDLGADAIAEVAVTAFGSEEARLHLLKVAFAFAHKLSDSFWDAQLELGATPGAQAYDRQKKEYAQRFRAWSKSSK